MIFYTVGMMVIFGYCVLLVVFERRWFKFERVGFSCFIFIFVFDILRVMWFFGFVIGVFCCLGRGFFISFSLYFFWRFGFIKGFCGCFVFCFSWILKCEFGEFSGDRLVWRIYVGKYFFLCLVYLVIVRFFVYYVRNCGLWMRYRRYRLSF